MYAFHHILCAKMAPLHPETSDEYYGIPCHPNLEMTSFIETFSNILTWCHYHFQPDEKIRNLALKSYRILKTWLTDIL